MNVRATIFKNVRAASGKPWDEMRIAVLDDCLDRLNVPRANPEPEIVPFDKGAFLGRFVNSDAPAITAADITSGAARVRVSENHIRAIMKVERGPYGSYDQSGRPIILPERHKFSRHTNRRFDASHPHISYRSWGKRPYPKSFNARWDELAEMASLDETAALMSASWGAFQVMGEHYDNLGYATVQDFVADIVAREAAHLDAAIGFIKVNSLDDELRACKAGIPKSCVPFVRAYNGPGYAKNRYQYKFAEALK